MIRTVLPSVVAAMATLFVALPMAAGAAADPAPLAPKRLVVDSVSAPVLSIDQAALLVDIVLVPDGDYQPVHPDSLGNADEAQSPALPDATGEETDKP
ncbi:MAG: hypothetical protein AB1451_10830 [Nitrospirota bacterium]